MEDKFESWAVIELMGHQKISGKVTEHKFGNQSMLRVDVPAVNGRDGVTKIIAVNAVYAINPVSEQMATEYAAVIKAAPLQSWDIASIFEQRIQELVSKGQLIKPELVEQVDEYERPEDW